MAARKRYGPLINKKGGLNQETAVFIRYYARKWKSKSVFQVLLQYRAARYHDLFNFSQQVHLYNQNVVNTLQKYNNEVDFNLIDPKANVKAWLGVQMPTVIKMPFRLDEIPFFDTSSMCTPITGLKPLYDPEEPWDAPYKWRLNEKDSKQPILRSLSKEHTEIAYHRDPEVPVTDLSPIQQEQSVKTREMPSKYKTPEPIYRPQNKSELMNKSEFISKSDFATKTESFKKSFTISEYQSPKKPLPKKILPKINYEPKLPSSSEFAERTNTSPANSDFEFIKPSQVKLRPTNTVNPITELEKLGKKVTPSGDEAPFNFQGMLRKTNFNRESLKRTVENINIMNNLHNNDDNRMRSMRSSLKKVDMDMGRKFCGEIAPGVYLEGILVDL